MYCILYWRLSLAWISISCSCIEIMGSLFSRRRSSAWLSSSHLSTKSTHCLLYWSFSLAWISSPRPLCDPITSAFLTIFSSIWEVAFFCAVLVFPFYRLALYRFRRRSCALWFIWTEYCIFEDDTKFELEVPDWCRCCTWRYIRAREKGIYRCEKR